MKLSFSCCAHFTARCILIDFRITLVVFNSISSQRILNDRIDSIAVTFSFIFSFFLFWSNWIKHIKLINGFLCHMRNFVTNQFLRWNVLKWFKGNGVSFCDSNSVQSFGYNTKIHCASLFWFRKTNIVAFNWNEQINISIMVIMLKS